MKTKHFRWVFLAALLPLAVLGNVREQVSLGASAEWTNDNYRFAGGTDIFALAYSLLLIVLYIFLVICSNLGEQGPPLPGVFRRFVAFWIDFAFVMMITVPLIGIISTLTEWKRTQVFQWNFERTAQAPDDLFLAFGGALVAFAAMTFYYTWPLLRRKPSPGACIMGYQIVSDEGISITVKMAILRTMLGFIALGGWPVAPFVNRDQKNGKFWLDKVFQTHAVKL